MSQLTGFIFYQFMLSIQIHSEIHSNFNKFWFLQFIFFAHLNNSWIPYPIVLLPSLLQMQMLFSVSCLDVLLLNLQSIIHKSMPGDVTSSLSSKSNLKQPSSNTSVRNCMQINSLYLHWQFIIINDTNLLIVALILYF